MDSKHTKRIEISLAKASETDEKVMAMLRINKPHGALSALFLKAVRYWELLDKLPESPPYDVSSMNVTRDGKGK